MAKYKWTMVAAILFSAVALTGCPPPPPTQVDLSNGDTEIRVQRHENRKGNLCRFSLAWLSKTTAPVVKVNLSESPIWEVDVRDWNVLGQQEALDPS